MALVGRTSSFEVRTSSVSRVVEAARARDGSGRSAVLFVSGDLGREVGAVARELEAARLLTSWLVVPAAGVLTERGEVEQESAAAGMVFPERGARLVLGRSADHEFGEAIADEVRAKNTACALVLLRGDQNDDGWLAALDARLGRSEERIFGGGTLPRQDLYLVDQSGARGGHGGAVIVERPWVGRVVASSACRLLSPLVRVTKTRGSMILELDGTSALSLLGASAQSLDDQPLVLLAVAASEGALSPEGRSLALRAIQGVDPGRGGLLLSDPLPEGTKVAFAVRDAHGARVDLDAHLRTLRRGCAGAAPAFGVYVSCAGRGRSLYETPSVDVRMIQQHFPDMPLVGLHSTFELAPLEGRLTPQIHTGVLSVFSAPS